MSDLISRADVLKYPIRLDHYDEVNGDRVFVYGVESVIEYVESLPSVDAVDCTDFIEWLVDRVLDETIWENNSVAYGEIICRKLEKLGVLEATEEPSYYIRPSADAVCKAHEEEHLNIINRIKELQYAIAKTQTIVGKMVESADAVQGEWVGLNECSVCGKQVIDFIDGWVEGLEYLPNFCPNCGAKMKGGAE